MRLIDADALLKDGIRVSCGHVSDEGIVMVPMKDVRKSIEAAPTIDPESLRPRGKWIPVFDKDGNPYRTEEYGPLYACSICGGQIVSDYGTIYYDNCPYCTARNDMEEK